MNVWIVGIGEPLVIDGKNVRLRRIGNFSKYLTENDVNLNYFSVSFDHYQKKQRVKKSTSFNINENYNLHVIYVPGYRKNVSLSRVLSHQVSAKRIRKKMNIMIENRPDVILCGNTPLEMVKEVVEFGEKHSIPTVIDIRDLWPEVFREVLPSSFNAIIEPYINHCKKGLSISLSKAYSIIGLSPAFVDYGLNIARRDKSNLDKVIPIGYPEYSYDITEDEFDKHWKKYNLNSDDFIVAFTGNFGRQFEFESIVEAANSLSNTNIKFVLCGLGENRDRIKDRCGKNVIFPGWVESDKINSLLSYSNIGIAPYIDSSNYRNNTPNKFGEYLAASLPILVSVSGVMEQLLLENNCGAKYNGGKDLAEIILNIKAKSPDNYKKNSRKLYETEFSMKIINQNMKDHLSYVIKSYTKDK